MKKILILLITTIFTVTAQSQLSYFLSNKFWRLKQAVINGQEYNFGGNANAPTLQFSGGSIRGNGGCNAYHTKFTINGDMLQIDKVMSTRMACNALSLEESIYFNALAQTHTIEYTEGSSEFRLINTSNDILVYYAQFEKAHSYTPPPPRRERAVNYSHDEEEVKPSLSKKQTRRKADLEKKMKRGKLSKAERRELISLQSKGKKGKVGKGKREKSVKGKKGRKDRNESRKSKGKKGSKKEKASKKGKKSKDKPAKKSKKKRR
jgi:heat shock protein HslJ